LVPLSSPPLSREVVAHVHVSKISKAVSADEAVSLRRYFDEISAHPLLTADDERRLGQVLVDGRMAQYRLDSDESVSAVEKRALRQAIRAAEEAREEFINSNLRLVVAVARAYHRPGGGMLDLIQEGNIGLMKAVDRFDHTKGFKFSTYATWWIRQAIGRFVGDNARAIRLPSHVRDMRSAIDQATTALTERLRREPTDAEIVELSGVSQGYLDLIRFHQQTILSLSGSVSPDDDATTLADLVADDADSPEDLAGGPSGDRIRELLSTLPPRDVQVLMEHYGFGQEPRGLSDIARDRGVTRQRVAHMEGRALARLKHPTMRPRIAALV
jgi:RNA polymerase primary sigma factor